MKSGRTAVWGRLLPATLPPMRGEVVFGGRELVENSVRAIVDNRTLVLPHVIDELVVRPAFRIVLEQENDAFHRSPCGLSTFNGGILALVDASHLDIDHLAVPLHKPANGVAISETSLTRSACREVPVLA